MSETVQDRTKVLITNRKSVMRFRLVPKSTTLDDPELTLNGYYAFRYITHMSFGADHKNLNEDRPILSATKMKSRDRSFFGKIRFMRIFAGVSWRGGFR